MLSYFKSPFFQKCHSKVTIELGLIDPSAGHPEVQPKGPIELSFMYSEVRCL